MRDRAPLPAGGSPSRPAVRAPHLTELALAVLYVFLVLA